jgi:hypothetical protein
MAAVIASVTVAEALVGVVMGEAVVVVTAAAAWAEEPRVEVGLGKAVVVAEMAEEPTAEVGLAVADSEAEASEVEAAATGVTAAAAMDSCSSPGNCSRFEQSPHR